MKKTSQWKIPLFKINVNSSDVNAVSNVIKRGTDWACGQEIIQLEKELSEAVGAKTEVSLNKKKGGKLVISFIDLESLQGILEKIKGKNCH